MNILDALEAEIKRCSALIPKTYKGRDIRASESLNLIPVLIHARIMLTEGRTMDIMCSIHHLKLWA